VAFLNIAPKGLAVLRGPGVAQALDGVAPRNDRLVFFNDAGRILAEVLVGAVTGWDQDADLTTISGGIGRAGLLCESADCSRRLRQVDDSVHPGPGVAFNSPEVSQQPRLLAIVRGTNAATEQDETAVILAGAEHLPCMPRKRRPVERHEHQSGFRARDQQRGIVQAQP
jgi:hypothetical protein